MQRYLLQTWTIFRKYTGHEADLHMKEHGLFLTRVFADLYGLRRELTFKVTLGPGLFIYLAYFRLTRDRTAGSTLGLTDSTM